MLVSTAVLVSGVPPVPTLCVSPVRCMPPEGMCESEEGVITGREPDDDIITDTSRHGSKESSHVRAITGSDSSRMRAIAGSSHSHHGREVRSSIDSPITRW